MAPLTLVPSSLQHLTYSTDTLLALPYTICTFSLVYLLRLNASHSFNVLTVAITCNHLHVAPV